MIYHKSFALRIPFTSIAFNIFLWFLVFSCCFFFTYSFLSQGHKTLKPHSFETAINTVCLPPRFILVIRKATTLHSIWTVVWRHWKKKKLDCLFPLRLCILLQPSPTVPLEEDLLVLLSWLRKVNMNFLGKDLLQPQLALLALFAQPYWRTIVKEETTAMGVTGLFAKAQQYQRGKALL